MKKIKDFVTGPGFLGEMPFWVSAVFILLAAAFLVFWVYYYSTTGATYPDDWPVYKDG